MKHLKYIREYFDSEEIKRKVGNEKIDFEEIVGDESIIEQTVLDVIVTRIKMDIPYIEEFIAVETKTGLMFTEGYDYYMSSGESLLSLLKMPIDVSIVPEELKSGNRLEDMIFQLSYESDIFWIENDKKMSIFRNEYVSTDNKKFKTCKGMKELISFIKSDIVPLMMKTRKMFEKTTLKKTHGKGNIPPIRYN